MRKDLHKEFKLQEDHQPMFHQVIKNDCNYYYLTKFMSEKLEEEGK